MPRFEREEDDRFWEIHLEADEKTVHSRAGFLGTDGRPSNKKTWDTKKAAAAEVKERIAEQLAAGYVEVPQWNEPASDELLAAIGANPTDVTGYLVYSDWLLGKKHPRGELIVLQSQLGSARTDRKLLEAEAKLLEKHGPKLAPPRCTEAAVKTRKKLPPLATSELRWENGFIAAARLCRPLAEQRWTIRDLLCELLQHPAGRFLRRLELGIRGDTKKTVSYRDAISDLARLAPASLRSLSVVEAPRDSAALAFSELGPLDDMLAAMPSLESLHLAGTKMSFGSGREMRGLKQLTVVMTDPEALTSLVEGRFPALESLELDASNAALELNVVKKLLDGDRVTKLTQLSLLRVANTDQVAEVLRASRLLERLTSLSLAGGKLSNGGASQLLENKRAFGHLASLDLSNNELSRPPKGLTEVCAKVVIGEQRGKSRASLSQAELATVASDSAAFAKARAVAGSKDWSKLKRDGSKFSGVYEGSDTYRVSFDAKTKAGDCTCFAMAYAKKGNCKHVVALAALAAEGRV
jgi:uncharacterized protein (TIGR02996 family)